MKNALLLILIILAPSPKKESYALNLEVGEVYTQEYVNNSSVNQTIMGMEQEITISIKSGVNFLVTKDLGDRYAMDVSYENITMTMNLPQGETKMSTEDGSDDLMSKLMGNIINKAFQIEIFKDGRVGKIKNLENIFFSMTDNIPDLTEEQRDLYSQQMMSSYGEDSFKGNIEMITAILPNGPLEIGDQWQNVTDLKSNFYAKLDNTYTLISANDSVVVIEGTSLISTEENGTTADVNGLATTYRLNGEMKSRYVLDSKTKWVKTGTVEQNIEGSAEIEDNPSIPGGLTIPMEIKNTIQIGQIRAPLKYGS